MRPQPATGARDWPQPVEILNEHGRSPVVLICEHASNHIPAEYDGLGLDAETLHDHIAWDIGAAAVTRALSRKLDIGRAHVCTPVTNAHLVCRLLLEKKNIKK